MINMGKKRCSKNSKLTVLILAGIILGIVWVLLVYAAPSFIVEQTISRLSEDQSPLFLYNFSSNVTNGTSNEIWTFSIEYVNSSMYPTKANISYYTWINLNSSTGLLTINATNDNQTGAFNLSIKVVDQTTQGSIRLFYFIVNATNDAPVFTSINSSYNFTQGQNSIVYVNASDEEMHYPLYFNASFLNCSLAPWSTRTNCTLFMFLNVTNTSSMINLNASRNDVGFYYIANISVTDNGANYTCISGFCETNYNRNRTTYYASLVNFTVFAALDINVSDCQNKIFQQNQSGTCIINITTRDIQDNYNVSSSGFLRNYAATVANSSWFYYFNQSTSVNYSTSIMINTTPQVTEVGNWTINFTLWDINFSQSLMIPINVYVNKTINFAPIISPISNQTTSINSSISIPVNVYDDDMLIPDKNMIAGGYNETLNFSAGIFNQSNLNQNLTINGFYNLSVRITNMPVLGSNLTTALILFTPNMTSYGNFTINLSATDRRGISDSRLFNISILNNRPPNWTDVNTNIILHEHIAAYFNFSMNVTSPDGNQINFSYSSDTSFPSFSIGASTGVVSFTPLDTDVGQHLVTITAKDPYYSVLRTFNFTVYNVNETPYIERPIQQSDVINAIVDSNSNINTVEDDPIMVNLWIQDSDLAIPSGQKIFYDERVNINLLIQGANTTLFNFVRDNSFPTPGNNRSKFYASFTPRKADIGSYNITITAVDNSGLSSSIGFNLTVSEIAHVPVIMNLTNITTAVDRSIYYMINATDVEDGNSGTPGNTNFLFRYNFLNGSDFINNNQSIFNTTTGELNITFNSLQGGSYRINISVNDSTNRIDSKTFWIYVYDFPSLISPPSSFKFNFFENVSYNITFKVNHSMANNLTYLILIKNQTLNNASNTVLYNRSFYGNSSNLTINFNPDFMNETYSTKNLTLIAYPSDNLLENATDMNLTVDFELNINHTDYPLTFFSNIGGSKAIISGGSPQTIILSDFFSDIDASDSFYNQPVRFGYNLISSSGSPITVEIVNWLNGTIPTMTFSSASDASSTYTVTGYEYNQSNSSQIIRNVTSNSFGINLSFSTVLVPVPQSGGGGGGGGGTPIILKIITPGIVSAYQKQKVSVPITLANNGKTSLHGIKISSIGFKDGKADQVVQTSLDRDSFDSLDIGKKEQFTLTFMINSNKTGNYEILLNASSDRPAYSDWAKIYVNLQRINDSDIKKYILFTEEFIVQNPNCLELKEEVDQAKSYFEDGDYLNARLKAEEVVNACKDHVSQVSLPRPESPLKKGFNNYYFFAACIVAFLLGLVYYYMRRRRIREASLKFYS
ncbi:Uncharacterised protein [uncultured archaeon]|nr:Uncharacterised protein [uncultured archaeon]